jgi:hypothetical protein
VFHLLLPIPKFVRADLVQNSESFKYNKVPHAFELTRYLKDMDDPNIKQVIESQMEAMDPNSFLRQSQEKYKEMIIE